MTAAEIRQKYLDFFREKGHAVIPSASLIPENDPTVLFTTAGMHPLVPYLIGEAHPMGKRVANVQKCLRTDDIEEVGDNRHLTFFEMLGNWSFGDYFKQEAIAWSFEFLTDPAWMGIDPTKLFVTVFEGDDDAARDEESIGIWQAQFEVHDIAAEMGIPGVDAPAKDKKGPRVYAYSKKKNWWGPAGQTGPCGPDTEMFYDTGRQHDPAFGRVCHPNCDCGRFVEIWNDVFMEYQKLATGNGQLATYIPLKQKNVDTGMGLERMAAVLQGVPTVFETQEFRVLIDAIVGLTDTRHPTPDTRSLRIIADHIKAATFIIGDQHGVSPSNVGQGYIARRLIRRAVREGRRLGIKGPFVVKLAQVVIGEWGSFYSELETNRDRVLDEMRAEEEKFAKTLEKGLKVFERMMKDRVIDGGEAFILFSTYGFPLELTQELVGELGGNLDVEAFKKEFEKHQGLSRSASAGTFKGGLADHSAETTRLHTATHLLHKALRTVLGDHVGQKGSNITAERLRFDFTHPQKMTAEEMGKVEDIVNVAIEKDYPVHFEVMSLEDAKKSGALGYFEDTYAKLGGKIKVYIVGDDEKGIFGKEICGGPHVDHTGELGSFKIQKEEAVSAGIRRIKATVGGT